jgi:DNA-binding response OmpR family regulator
VLIVEDDALTALVLSEYLTAHGYRVTVAVNGVDGINTFNLELPDIALVDVLLPRKDGFEVCSEIKLTHHGRYTPVVLMSAVYRSLEQAESHAHRLLADGFLVKPFDLDLLVSRVNALVGGP